MKGNETKHVAAFRQSNLKNGETIEFFMEGWIGEMMGKKDKAQHNGTFILTNERAIFYRKGIFGEVLETMPLSKITSVETRSMMGHRVLRLHTSHDELAFKTFETKELFDQVYARLEDIRHGPDTKTAPAAAPPDGPLEQIKKLSELRDVGILSDEEFASKKADLLSRL